MKMGTKNKKETKSTFLNLDTIHQACQMQFILGMKFHKIDSEMYGLVK